MHSPDTLFMIKMQPTVFGGRKRSRLSARQRLQQTAAAAAASSEAQSRLLCGMGGFVRLSSAQFRLAQQLKLEATNVEPPFLQHLNAKVPQKKV